MRPSDICLLAPRPGSPPSFTTDQTTRPSADVSSRAKHPAEQAQLLVGLGAIDASRDHGQFGAGGHQL